MKNQEKILNQDDFLSKTIVPNNIQSGNQLNILTAAFIDQYIGPERYVPRQCRLNEKILVDFPVWPICSLDSTLHASLVKV